MEERNVEEFVKVFKSFLKEMQGPQFWLIAFFLILVPRFNSRIAHLLNKYKDIVNALDIIDSLISNILVIYFIIIVTKFIYITVKEKFKRSYAYEKPINELEKFLNLIFNPVFLWFHLIINVRLIFVVEMIGLHDLIKIMTILITNISALLILVIQLIMAIIKYKNSNGR